MKASISFFSFVFLLSGFVYGEDLTLTDKVEMVSKANGAWERLQEFVSDPVETIEIGQKVGALEDEVADFSQLTSSELILRKEVSLNKLEKNCKDHIALQESNLYAVAGGAVASVATVSSSVTMPQMFAFANLTLFNKLTIGGVSLVSEYLFYNDLKVRYLELIKYQSEPTRAFDLLDESYELLIGLKIKEEKEAEAETKKSLFEKSKRFFTSLVASEPEIVAPSVKLDQYRNLSEMKSLLQKFPVIQKATLKEQDFAVLSILQAESLSNFCTVLQAQDLQ